jgi:hypothetical protein
MPYSDEPIEKAFILRKNANTLFDKTAAPRQLRFCRSKSVGKH